LVEQGRKWKQCGNHPGGRSKIRGESRGARLWQNPSADRSKEFGQQGRWGEDKSGTNGLTRAEVSIKKKKRGAAKLGGPYGADKGGGGGGGGGGGRGGGVRAAERLFALSL